MFSWCGRLRLQVSLQCSDTASHCFSIQHTEGEPGEEEKERDQALASEEAGEEVEWAKQEHRGFWGWIRDRESLSIPALMPKLLTESRMLSSLRLQWQLCHLLVFLESIHTAGASRERHFYRWLLQVLKICPDFSVSFSICICFSSTESLHSCFFPPSKQLFKAFWAIFFCHGKKHPTLIGQVMAL